ncbi:autotransporter outer membrane beta-barrel domain-containing protein [Variovorax saccharolyticus]|uniref:autotransporter outer membrane beta-barrel domain-containing protein n=1 Tax=Variovorax saccharolyticus TaxID=3053516 RepID=UPI002575DD3A|nr:autotransporter outer membrane beta-barrel domain-containing protein [Variovorax sp. J31P216]MDM0026257.1 autotransporter outer membrane beta-barrel domain-containing protein [Variovorax sp. J31P216]
MSTGVVTGALACMIPGPALADCLPNPPASGQTVTCSGPAPTTVPLDASAASGVTVNVNADAVVTGSGNLIVLGAGAQLNNFGSIEPVSTGAGNIGVVALGDNSTLRNFGTLATTGFNSLSFVSVGNNSVLRNEAGARITISGDLATGLIASNNEGNRLVNAGQITLNTFQGAGMFAQASNRSELTNTATGAIESNLDEAFGMAAIGGTGHALRNEGSIVTRGQGSHGMLLGEATSSTLVNAGSITTSGGSSETVNRAFGMFVAGGQGNTLQNTASGVITASGIGSSAMEVAGSGGNLLRNDGTLNVGGTGAHGLFVLSGAGNTLDNRGIVNTSGQRGNGMRADDGDSSFFNSGELLVGGRDAFGVFMQGNNNTLVNSGTIRASGINADGVLSNTTAGGFVARIENTGSIISERGFAVRGVNGQETVVNAGVIRSDAGTAIDLRAGNDTLILRAGSVITGLADGGTGTDRVILEGAGTASNAFANFETLRMSGSDWTWSGSGAFNDTQIESGVLRVSGTLTSPVTVQAGTQLRIGTGAASGTVTGSITDNGAVVFNRSDDLSYGGVIGGTGSLTQQGPGTLTLTGANSYSGGTTIAGGVLGVGADANLGAASGGLTFNAGSLRLSGSFDTARPVTLNAGGGTIDTAGTTNAFSGVISGAGALAKAGSGTLVLVANNGYAGGTTIAGGTLQLGNGGTSGSVAGDILNNANLVFNRSDTLTYAGIVSGTGSMSQQGPGLLILPGHHSYSGPTTVQQGALWVNGSIASATTVAAAGTLGGTGTIFGNVLNRGVVAPGNSIGTLTINGNYVGQGGAILRIESQVGNDASPTDKLVIVGGAVTGSTAMQVVNLGGTGALTTGSGIAVVLGVNGATTAAGAFSLAAPVAAGPYEYLLYRGGITAGTTENWYLRSTAPATPVASVDMPVPPPVPQAAPGSPPVPAAAAGQPPRPLYRPEVAVQAALPPLAGELSLVTLGTFHERRGEQGRLSGSGPLAAGWGRAFGQSDEQRWSGDVSPEFDGSMWGVQLGVDLYGIDRTDGHRDRFGAFFGHGQARGDVRGTALGRSNTPVGRIELENNSLGAYWTHIGPSDWYVDGVLMQSWLDGDPRSNRGVGTSTDGNAFTASLEAGYPIVLGRGWTLEPQGQLIWQRVSLDGTQDRFSTIAYDDHEGFTGRLGVRLQGSLQWGGAAWQPWLRANLWRGAHGTGSVVFGGVPIATRGDATALEIGAGIDVQITKAVGFYATAGYTTSIDGDRRKSIGGNAGVRVAW